MLEEIHVRVGTPEDLEGCMELFVRANEENGLAEMDVQKLISLVWPSLHQDGGMIGIIGPVGRKPEGVVLLRIEQLWYADAPVIAEKLVYVHPDYRSAKGGRARKLCEFSKQVADELEMPLLIGVVSTERTKGKIRLYERLFGEPAGVFFLHGAKTGLAKEQRAGDS